MPTDQNPNPPITRRNPLAFLKPSATHSAYSATLLLMVSSLLSGVLGLVRIKYTNYLFGAGVAQDAYRAAFALPDLLAYFLIGRLLGPGVPGLPGRRRQGLFTQLGADGEQLEFGYCFDVAIRAFFPVWVFLYVFQFLLMPVIVSEFW